MVKNIYNSYLCKTNIILQNEIKSVKPSLCFIN
jgi:hypothetical protein